MCEPTSPAAATRTSSTIPRMPFRPRSFMCRTINSRRTEGKLANREPAIFRPMATLIARSWGAGLTVLAALGAAGCAVNPATGARQLMLISASQEIAMGRDYDQQVAASIGLYADTAWQRWIQQFGARLAASSERPNLPWTFHVVDDPVVNAFALPGGYIYVTRGILAHLNSEAELGGVVGDDLGLRYMRRANYDPREMPHVFEMLTRVSQAQGGGRVPEWLATHPNPENRRGRIEQEIAALRQDFSGAAVNRDTYLRRLDGLVFGNNPREGYFKENQFFHPDLRFRVTFPEGWTTNNGKQAVIAVSPQQDAMVEVSGAKEPTADAAARAFLAQQGLTNGYPGRTSVGGLPAVTAGVAAATDHGTLSGTVLFAEHGGAVYRLVGYATDARWPAVQVTVERALQSFARLTDPAALAVQPQRGGIVRIDP